VTRLGTVASMREFFTHACNSNKVIILPLHSNKWNEFAKWGRGRTYLVQRGVAEDDGALCWTTTLPPLASVSFLLLSLFPSSSHVCFCSFLCFLPPFVFRSCSLPLCYSFFTRSSPCFLLPAVFVLLVPLQFPSPFFCGLLWLL
jgi:hypothetical protein